MMGFSQQIEIQVGNEEALKLIWMTIQVCGIQIKGRNLTVEIRSKMDLADLVAKHVARTSNPPPGLGQCL